MADRAVVGQVGDVVVRIPGGNRPGEIRAQARGIGETFIAYAESPFDRGEKVLVIAVRGPRQVDVVAWYE